MITHKDIFRFKQRLHSYTYGHISFETEITKLHIWTQFILNKDYIVTYMLIYFEQIYHCDTYGHVAFEIEIKWLHI